MPARGRTGPGSFFFLFLAGRQRWAELVKEMEGRVGGNLAASSPVYSFGFLLFLIFISETGFNLVSKGNISLGDDVTWPFGTKGSGSQPLPVSNK
jgi:hypothetical protein